jgi:hypothetical protein
VSVWSINNAVTAIAIMLMRVQWVELQFCTCLK